MKTVFIILCIICILIPCIVYGVGIAKTINMDANCISYFELAADTLIEKTYAENWDGKLPTIVGGNEHILLPSDVFE